MSCLHELAVAQGGEHAVTLHEIVVTAALDDATGVQYVDAVDAADGAQPVGDHQTGDAELLERLLDHCLCAVVQCARRLVKNNDPGLAHERAGD